jgi:hypothetical protein
MVPGHSREIDHHAAERPAARAMRGGARRGRQIEVELAGGRVADDAARCVALGDATQSRMCARWAGSDALVARWSGRRGGWDGPRGRGRHGRRRGPRWDGHGGMVAPHRQARGVVDAVTRRPGRRRSPHSWWNTVAPTRCCAPVAGRSRPRRPRVGARHRGHADHRRAPPAAELALPEVPRRALSRRPPASRPTTARSTPTRPCSDCCYTSAPSPASAGCGTARHRRDPRHGCSVEAPAVRAWRARRAGWLLY